MSTPSLPNELLLHLFRFVTSSNELALLTYSCKTFAEVIKPLLYSHVTIETKHQRASIRNVKAEDVKLIKKVSIVGNSSVWDHGVEDLDRHFEGKAVEEQQAGDEEEGGKEEICELGGGCVQELFEGKLFDVGAVESIVIQDIYEQPRRELQDLAIVPSLFKNLRNLTVISHRGGARLWKTVLQKKYLPAVRRLTMYDVTSFAPAGSVPPPQSQNGGQTILSFGEENSVRGREGGGPKEFVVTETILKPGFCEQLEILVSPEYPFLRLQKYAKLIRLAIVTEDADISPKTKYAIAFLGYNVFQSDTTDNIFHHLDYVIVRSKKDIALEYLSLGSYYKDCSEIFDETTDAAVAKGIKVFYDGDENPELIPQSFLDLIAGKEKKKGKEGLLNYFGRVE